MGAPEREGGQDRAVIEQAIRNDEIRSLQLGPAITLPIGATLQEAVETLQQRHIGCVLLVSDDGKLAGIFTERDLLNKVAGQRLAWK
jgi:CBS domain-containing protein